MYFHVDVLSLSVLSVTHSSSFAVLFQCIQNLPRYNFERLAGGGEVFFVCLFSLEIYWQDKEFFPELL